MTGWLLTLMLPGCADALKALTSDAFNMEIQDGTDCGSGPADERTQSLELADVGEGVLAVLHTCADINTCAEDDDYVVKKTQSDGEITLKYDYIGEVCELSTPRDLYYELELIPAGDWTVRYNSLSAQITME